MKSTYKLFGAYWDGMQAVKYDELHIYNSTNQSMEPISFQQLLSVQNETELSRIITPYETNNAITIGIDYRTESTNPILRVFLEKRLCQMIAHLSERFQSVRCVRV
ncbi:MAG: hypothetical protein K6F14_03800 [Clostridiales bacterium]|nr:hypothetical protein [Clostridiales bacterium]